MSTLAQPTAAPAAAAAAKPARGRDIAAPSNAPAPSAENIGLSDLTSLLLGNKKNLAKNGQGGTAAPAPNEQPPGQRPANAGRRGKPNLAAAAAPAPSAPAPELGAGIPEEAPVQGQPEEQPPLEHEEEVEQPAGDPGEQPAGDPGEQTEGGEGNEGGEPALEGPALHPELAQALADLKASGNKGAAKLLTRLHKLVDQRDTQRMARLQAEQQAQVLHARVRELESDPNARTPEPAANRDRFSTFPQIAATDKLITKANNVIDWCEANMDGAEVDGQSFSPEQIRTIRSKADRDLMRLEATRAADVSTLATQQNGQRAQYNAQARSLYPWIKQSDSPQFKAAMALINAFPAIKNAPGMELMVGRYIAGMEAEQKRTANGAGARPNGAPKPRPAAAPTALTGRPAAVAPRTSRDQTEVQAATATLEKSGRVQDLAQLFVVKGTARANRQRAA